MSSETKSRVGLREQLVSLRDQLYKREHADEFHHLKRETYGFVVTMLDEILGSSSSADTGGREAALTEQQVERIHQIIEQYSTDVIDYAIATDDINAFLERGADTGTTGAEGLHVGWIAGHCSDPMNCPVCKAGGDKPR